MPFAQVHYPFENREWFDEPFPGRLHRRVHRPDPGLVLHPARAGRALFDRPAFKTCLAHGILLGDDGQKLSKRLRNYPDPEAMFDTHGADAMRWFLMSSPVLRGGDMIADEKGITDAVRAGAAPAVERLVLLLPVRQRRRPPRRPRPHRRRPARSTATSSPRPGSSSTPSPRPWTPTTCRAPAPASSPSWTSLNNWYIRRSRDRFWGTGSGDRGRHPGRLRHAGHGPRGAVPGGGAAPAARHRGGLAGADRGRRHGRVGPPGRLAGSPRRCQPIPTWWRTWTGSARSVRPPIRSARPTACGPACRSPASPWRRRTPAASRPYVDLIKDEVNVKSVTLTDGRGPVRVPAADRGLQGGGAPAGSRDPGRRRRRPSAATGSCSTDGRARVGDSVLEPGEFEMRVQPVDEATTRALGGHPGWWSSTSTSPTNCDARAWPGTWSGPCSSAGGSWASM